MITRCLSCEQSATRYEQQRAFSTQAMNTKETGETKKKKKKDKTLCALLQEVHRHLHTDTENH